MSKTLNDVAYFFTEKINCDNINIENYISTDNMLPDKKGICNSEYVPQKGMVYKYNKGDVLLSNIRPYFKKVWLADRDGGCCADVLVLKPINITSEFLYAIVSQDHFFKYVMAGAKGSKMPRGDKNHILKYPIKDIENKDKIGKIINEINKKIQNNNKINEELENMAKTIYDYWFLQFDFPDENGKPYKSSGGKMVWNEELKREIPEGWEVGNIEKKGIYTSDYTANGSFAGLAENVKYNNGEKFALLVRILDLKNNFSKKEDLIYVNKHAYNYLEKSNLFGGEIIICNVGDVGATFMCPQLNIPMTLGPNGIVIRSDKYNEYMYMFFKSEVGQMMLNSISSGSIQLKFNKTNFRKLPIVFPKDDILRQFVKIYKPIKDKMENLWGENKKLSSLRDFLLPLLMNGQVNFKEK